MADSTLSHTDAASTPYASWPIGRRGFLAAAPATVIVAALPAIASPSEWCAALATFQDADALYNRAVEREWVAEEAYNAIRPVQPRGGIVIQSRGQCFTLDEALANAQAERETWERADAQAKQSSGLAAAEAAVEEAGDRYVAARKALLACPAPDLAAVIFKVPIMQESNGPIGSIVADLERLAGFAAQHREV